MATQEDRSLGGSGISFPKWMKNKMTDKLDFEQSAFSPTELDDSFMFYYRNNNRSSSEPPQALSTVLVDPQKQTLTSAPVIGKKPDFSKHTLYCQKFLNNPVESASSQIVQHPETSTKVKSSGVDDGFKGEAAKCGTSVIRVANQIVAGKVIRGFNMETNKDCDAPPEGFNPAKRRGSRSLPSSPLSSPKSLRRVNKYFTGPFTDSESHPGGWSLSNLLSSKRTNISQSVGYIAEEEPTSSNNTIPRDHSVDDISISDVKKHQVFVAKPSELREMNFWSPTSM